jgi:DNA polymerase-2
VKEPVPGFYRAVTCFDYASLYPSIMRQFNISPESFIKKETDPAKIEEAKKDRSKIVAASGSIYGTELSVMKEILTNLYSDRRKHKDLHLELERYLAKRKK